MWLLHPSCSEVVDRACRKPQQGSLSFQVFLRIIETKSQLQSWDNNVFGNLQHKINLPEQKLADLQLSPQLSHQSLQSDIRSELDFYLHCQEIHLAQKAR